MSEVDAGAAVRAAGALEVVGAEGGRRRWRRGTRDEEGEGEVSESEEAAEGECAGDRNGPEELDEAKKI